MTNIRPTIELFTRKRKLIADRAQTIDVLVRITPQRKETNGNHRPNLNLGMVLDRSGSMGGEKMREAREAVKYCVDQMLPSDRLSTVIFDDRIDVLFPSQHMESANKRLLKSEIDMIDSRGSTALHEAWVKGGIQVAGHLTENAINRVILVTDGQANVGETDPDQITRQARELAKKGVSTSTIGIGRDFNEDLLMPMAEGGNGNSWHVQEAADMARIFSVELKQLLDQVANSVRLHVRPSAGARVVDLLNDFEPDGEGRYKLPNLQAGSPLDVVVQLRVQPHQIGNRQAAEFRLEYIDQETGVPETLTVNLELEFGAEEEVVALSENLEVVQAVQLLINARARLEAMTKMDQHDRVGAVNILRSAVASTGVLFSLASSPEAKSELQRELDELNRQAEKIQNADDDLMARKEIAFARYSRRTGK